MFFWWICWGESGLPVLFLHHLRATSLIFSLKLALSLSFFTLIERLSSSSLLSAIRVISSTYLRLLMFFLPILILAYNSSSPAFLMMLSAYRLNRHGNSIFSFLNLAPINCSIQCSNCCFLTCTQASQETGKMICYSHFFKSFPQFIMIHTVKGFGIVNETEVDVFLEFPSSLYDPANVGFV